MQSQITIITISLFAALIIAFVAAIGTCQHVKRIGELRTKEAQEQAGEWERKARAYAEALERAEDARRRAEQSTLEYTQEAEKAEEKREDARQKVEEMRKDAGDCGWLDSYVPDRVRDIIQDIYPGSGCD